MKTFLDHPARRRLAATAALGLVRLIFRTHRISLQGDEEGKALFQSEAPVVFAVWHGQLLTALFLGSIFAARKPGIMVMTSPSRDGEFIAEVARGLGLLTCPGSRHKGGFQALQNLVAWIRRGYAAALAADGSRGPLHAAQKGVLYLGRETQVPILPFAAVCRPKLTLPTWDRFEVALPFGRSALVVGEPLRLNPEIRGASLESCRVLLENRLNSLFRDSRNLF